MDDKTLSTLEYFKILERLASYADFSASADLIRALRPTTHFEEALAALQRTSEARRLININVDATIGASSDIRPLAEHALRGGTLDPQGLLEVRNTLVSARELARVFEKNAADYPHLAEIALALPPPVGIIDLISRAISDRGEVLDQASPKLSTIRSEMKVAHERLLSRLERLVNDPKTAPMLQENLITQRNGRYVVPLRADFKGRIRAIVHDQSASGATVFVEPLFAVELNNQWHELQLAERDEERRILNELSTQVGSQAVALSRMVEALAQLDVALASAKYAEDLRASEPQLVPFSPRRAENHPGSVIRLYHARHPLLDPASVVPIDIDLDEKTFSLIITGPNTGGKTVTLKTVGLMALMAQSGLHIPVMSGSTISLFKEIFADIGDEQSIEQSLSTFSGHITNIVYILNQAGDESLVLLDELGAGTDPQEGAALARSIVHNLVERRITALIATHYPELKTYAHATPGVMNACMEFSLETLRPTYRLTIGLPGRSNALAIAERLGLPQDIIQSARATISPDDLRADDLLDEIHQQRDLARRARAEAERAKNDAARIRAELRNRLDQIEEERRKVLEKAQRRAENEIGALQNELDEVRRALSRARQPLEALKPLEEKVEDLEEKSQKPITRRQTLPAPTRAIRPGEKVKVRSINMRGLITLVSENEVEVQIGNLRLRTRLNDLMFDDEEAQLQETAPQPVKASPSPEASSTVRFSTSSAVPLYPSPGMELDLRGQRAEDALEALDRYLESAFLAGLPYVRIIHGKGTGRLRTVIRQALTSSSHVKRWENGQDKEGGEGVTVAHLQTD